MQNQPVLGIDIGGSGIKGALVDLAAGDFAAPRVRIPTPSQSTPANVADVVAEIVAEFADQMGDGPIGTTIPAVVTHGIATLGTGIGSAVLYRGVLIPNSELGHLEIDGHDAETQAAASIKTLLGLSYSEYVLRLQRYYEVVESLFWPDLFVVGGGVSKDADKFMPKLKLKTPIVPAHLRNRAGIIGAAWLAVDKVEHPERPA